MNRNKIEEKINMTSGISQYVRVSETHTIELYLGKNEHGAPTLRYNGKFQPVKIMGNNILEIKQFKLDDFNSLLFSCNDNNSLPLFYSFCEDIINNTENIAEDKGYIEIVNRYNLWKKLFYSNPKVLSENEVLGLIGELLFLKQYCFSIYGVSKALKGWSGPEPTHKDFSYDKDWFEVKSINSFKNTISISSIEQLDSAYEGKLVVYSFEKMSSSFLGLSLNDLVKEILNDIDNDIEKDLFIEKLKQVKYSYNEIYDEYVFDLISINKYIVNNDFPKIRLVDLMKGIGKVKYEIMLSQIEQFREE